MLLVSFHGSKPGGKGENNVAAFNGDGERLSDGILVQSPGVVLSELRALYLANGVLYVVNANKTQSSVLRYIPSGSKYLFDGFLLDGKLAAAIVHPFDLAFDDSHHVFLSCQDTNVVLRFHLSADGKVASPADIAPAIAGQGAFLPGTFVASSVQTPCATATPVAPPLGLAYALNGDIKHSVRGIAWWQNALYVADQPAQCIKIYDPDGNLLGSSNPVESPVHVEVWRGSLFVSGGDQVMTAHLTGPPGDLTLVPLQGAHVKNSSGLAFSDSGNVYVASRTERRIGKFDAQGKPLPFRCPLPDDPEFLLHLPHPAGK